MASGKVKYDAEIKKMCKQAGGYTNWDGDRGKIEIEHDISVGKRVSFKPYWMKYIHTYRHTYIHIYVRTYIHT
jgi:hypothetical protein